MPRTLGLDFGTRRVGAALGDPRGEVATPLEVYARRGPRLDADHYRRLVEREGVERIVVGLPLHTGGGEGELARLAREFGAWIAAATGRPVVFHDERYSTYEAEEALRAAGLKAKDRQARRDMLAAQILLQSYLDAGSPTVEAPARPLADPVEEEKGS